MKVVIAPDSYKESLWAAEAASALAEGVLAACPSAVIDVCPMADGGEGTAAAMLAALGGEWVRADVYNALGSQVRARLAMLGEPHSAVLPGEVGISAARGRALGDGEVAGRTAVLDMAAASGLALIDPERRDPFRATTFGTGQLIAAALDAGAREIIVALGGSATVDGGAGCAQALGAEFIDDVGEPIVCGIANGGLEHLARIDRSGLDPRLSEVTLRAACDVSNPLLGERGAAAVFGPQKGATPEGVVSLEKNLAQLARVMREQLDADVETLPGGGAAGGLGAGLAGLLGASLEKGAALVATTVDLAGRLRGADLCITGEGRLDASTAFGKAPLAVAEDARIAGVPCVCVPGCMGDEPPVEVFADVLALVDGEVTARAAMEQPEHFLRQRAGEAIRRMLRR
jgi:glycerate kinase